MKSIPSSLLFMLSIICLSSIGLSGCSLFFGSDPDEVSSHVVEDVELILSRASLGGVEYEHYKVKGGLLYTECGVVSFGRYNPSSRDLSLFPKGQARPLLKASYELLDVVQESGHTWQQAGGLQGLSDPGKLVLHMYADGAPYSLTTSVDGIATPNRAPEKRLRYLVELLRGSIAAPLCRNEEFFGIGRVSAWAPLKRGRS